jgi:cellulose synthase/poly-beta-1,6-N-acetylglucosamine synthase-like glycosyltransferase
MLLLLICYLTALVLVAIYSAMQLQLVLLFFWHKYRQPAQILPTLADADLPFITVQLPIYNEQYVVQRLLWAVSELDYPSDKLELQILDDSTDDTSQIISDTIAEIQQIRPFLAFHYCHRIHRQGFKAGALAEGLATAKGEFIAIFDADFLPKSDFLRQTVPFFIQQKQLGFLQTRWTHINEYYSFLTRMQALALDAHFAIEQFARNRAGAFINFNGTAGLWRREAIDNSGGWQSDTITEDLDLSYRAQMQGWTTIYIDSITTPAELPIAMPAIKSQQYRWNKGAAECARKNLALVWRQPQLSIFVKLNATAHLLNSSIFILVFVVTILSVPVAIFSPYYPEYAVLMNIVKALGASLAVVALFFGTSFFYRKGFGIKQFFSFVLQLPLFLATTYGLSLFNALAVIAGLMGRKTPFVRTPKFNTQANPTQQKNAYIEARLSRLWWAELALFCYFFAAFLFDIYSGIGSEFFFHGLVAFGYAVIVGYEYQHLRLYKKK